MENTAKDEEHLRLLAIFHFVLAGATALFSMFPILHLIMGLAIVGGALDSSEGQAPAFIGWFFVGIATVIILCGLSVAALIAFAGRALQQRKRYTFCLVVAGISCIMMPLGTVLGVFTIIVLMRDSVKQLFVS